MKKVLRVIIAIAMIVACVFSLLSCWAGVQEILNIKEYKESDAQMARDGVEEAREGMAQLTENLTTYTEGVGTYEAGQVTLAEGYVTYYEGQQTLADGKQQIADNTQAYNEGKAKLESLESLVSMVETYATFREENNLEAIPGFDSFQAFFAGVITPLGASLGLEIPEDCTDVPQYLLDMVADGKAQLKVYEDGLQQIADGEVALAEGAAQLADGEQQLADGNAQLLVFEDGQETLRDGMYQLMEGETETVHYNSGEQQQPSLGETVAEIIGVDPESEDFLYTDETYRGKRLVDFDACEIVCQNALDYLDVQTADIENEFYFKRFPVIIAMALGSIFGIIGALILFFSVFGSGKKTGKVWLFLAAIASVAGAVYAWIACNDLVFLTRDDAGVYQSTQPFAEQIKMVTILAVVAVIAWITAKIASKNAKKKITEKSSKKAAKSAPAAVKSAEEIYAQAAANASKDAATADTYKE